MTANEFYATYAKLSGVDVKAVLDSGGTAHPCQCGKKGCLGWVMRFKCGEGGCTGGRDVHPPEE